MPKKYQLHSGDFEVSYDVLDGMLLMPDHKYPAPNNDHIIWVNGKLKGLRKMDTLIHELLHEEFPEMSEQDVLRAGSNIAKVMFGEGYRHKDEIK